MKLQELVKEKKPTKSSRLKIIIFESQFKALARNVLNEQEQNTIKKTHLIKIKRNENKN
jgi:hypothetical protein